MTKLYSKLCKSDKVSNGISEKRGKRKGICYLECEYLIINKDNGYECSKGFMEDNNDE